MGKGKKVLALILSLTLCASLLAACGGKSDEGSSSSSGSNTAAAEVNKEGFPIVNEPITLTMMGPDMGMAKWSDMLFFKEMEKKTGIKFEFQNAPNENFETKRQLVLASGDYPDVFFGGQFKAADEVNYGGQGILLPLEEYIDGGYAPNLKKILDENPDVRKSITTPDGHIYTLPFIDLAAVWYMGPMWYNGEFLKKLGYDEVPQTTDELYTYLKRVKTEDPNGNGKADEIPLTSVKLNDGIRMWLMGSFGIGYEDIYADANGKVSYAYTADGYKDYLTFLNKLWNEDLLDHETFSQTNEQKKAKGNNNQVALFQDYHAYFTLGGEPNKEDVMYQPVKSSVEGSPVAAKHPGLAKGPFAISSANKHPEATMRWVDYFYSTEGSDFLVNGPEGLLFEYVNKDTFEKKRLDAPDGKDREEYRATITPAYGINLPQIANEQTSNGFKDDFSKWLDEETAKKITPFARVPFPSIYLSQAEQDQVSAIRSDLKTYVEQMEAKFVTGQEPLSNYDKYIETANKMGAQKMVDMYQAAYDQWKNQ
ncbi:extracellular solute-binding protein [Paenibacillus aquistagni]|uniref:extracellular solute-binding protein n=1 Tax=Paenibacillus aquistagni TaxID=1852522 RepID=UPI00145BF8CD|nr:extracellular solute-binding protein [Paenibacillus aquistagni]NMM52998.1 extracellular solute-binding protein [Paenibacillus aquistagni]